MSDDDDRRWSNRRAVEADAAGITAARLRRAILDAVDERDPKMLRAAAAAYVALVEKADALSGADHPTADRKGTALDELDQRRAAREAGAAVRAHAR